MPTLNKITIRGKKYDKPSLERMKRKQIKKLPELLNRIEASQNAESEIEALGAVEVLWDFVAIIMPELPEKILDDLEVGECQEILNDSGFMPNAAELEEADDVEDISLGES